MAQVDFINYFSIIIWFNFFFIFFYLLNYTYIIPLIYNNLTIRSKRLQYFIVKNKLRYGIIFLLTSKNINKFFNSYSFYKINFFDYIYNNIFYFYHIYTIVYKLIILLKFNIQYRFNILKYYIILNQLVANILRCFLLLYYYINRIFLWINRRFLKKRKRFRIYYKFHNIRYWKILLFFFYINVFFLIWKRRNLYRKSQIFMTLIFLHIGILISLHFFLSVFESFDIAMICCIFFFSILLIFFKR